MQNVDYNHSLSAGTLEQKYNNSGYDDCNIGYDSHNDDIDDGLKERDNNHELYDTGRFAMYGHGQGGRGTWGALSLNSKDMDDSEVTAPPTPRSTDSEEEHRKRLTIQERSMASARLKQALGKLTRGHMTSAGSLDEDEHLK